MLRTSQRPLVRGIIEP